MLHILLALLSFILFVNAYFTFLLHFYIWQGLNIVGDFELMIILTQPP